MGDPARFGCLPKLIFWDSVWFLTEKPQEATNCTFRWRLKKKHLQSRSERALTPDTARLQRWPKLPVEDVSFVITLSTPCQPPRINADPMNELFAVITSLLCIVPSDPPPPSPLYLRCVKTGARLSEVHSSLRIFKGITIIFHLHRASQFTNAKNWVL